MAKYTQLPDELKGGKADEADEIKTPEEPSKDESDDDIIAEAKEFFEQALTEEEEQRQLELEDIRFSGLMEQWPEALKAIREGDPSGARPCLVTDKINQYKNQIVNDIRKNRSGIKVRPVDDTADIEVAKVFEGLIRHIEDTSKADIAYDFAADGAVTSGLGYVRIVTEYVGDTFQQEIKIKRVPNRFSVYTKFKEPDGSDQKQCIISELVNRKQFQKMYPKCNTSDWNFGTGDSDWVAVDDVRIAEYMRLKKTKTKLHLLQDGNSMFADEYEEKYGNDTSMIVKTRDSEKTIVEWFKLTAYEILERTTMAGQYIPVVPCVGVETWIDNRKYLRGIVRGAKDSCRLYNYQRSTVAELLGLHAKAPYIGASGQFSGHEDVWNTANTVSYSYLEYEPVTIDGHLVGKPERQAFAGVPAGLIQDMQTSEHDIQASLGMYQASIGQDSNAKSGKALNAQANQGDTATFHFQDNHAKMIRQVGIIILNMIPELFDTALIIRTLGEDGDIGHVQHNPDQVPAMIKQRDPQTNAVKKIFNLGVGKYDVTATVAPSYSSKRQEGADWLSELVRSSPESMQIVGDLMFKAMDMPYANIAAERYKKMLPPQLQDNENEDLSPEAAQIKQQADQQVQQLTQQLDQAHQAMIAADQEAKQHVMESDSLKMQLAQEKLKSQQTQVASATQMFDLKLQAQAAIDNANHTMTQVQIDAKHKELDAKNVEVTGKETDMQVKLDQEATNTDQLVKVQEELQIVQSTTSQVLAEISQTLAELAKPKQIQMVAPSGNVYQGRIN